MLSKSTHRMPKLSVTHRKPCLVTGGSDGNVFFWDYKSKKRVSQIHSLPSSVSSLAFNSDGSYLAIGSSYLYENGKQAEYRLSNPLNLSVSEPSVFIKPIESKDISKQSSVFIKQPKTTPSFALLYPGTPSAPRNTSGTQKGDCSTSHSSPNPSQTTPNSS